MEVDLSSLEHITLDSVSKDGYNRIMFPELLYQAIVEQLRTETEEERYRRDILGIELLISIPEKYGAIVYFVEHVYNLTFHFE